MESVLVKETLIKMAILQTENLWSIHFSTLNTKPLNSSEFKKKIMGLFSLLDYDACVGHQQGVIASETVRRSKIELVEHVFISNEKCIDFKF